ncbi:MAG: PstS family phosphate ABC transporter substrate-binding protein [Prochlorotrichaceae cyanobacterium]
MLSQFSISRVRFLSLLAALSLGIAACGGDTATSPEGTAPEGAAPAEGGGAEPAASDLSGDIAVDGSSTVFPISEAMAEEFMAANAGVRITVGVSGTGGGFKKFCAGETDIANASRPIKKEEIELCATNKIEYIEVPVAYDGLSIVVNTANSWATCLTDEELGKMWEPGAEGKVTKWNQIRADFPDKELALYAPGTDSGTYDYFVESIVDKVTGKKGSGTRGDGTFSEDDNVIVQGVESNENSLGFFGYAYYEENKDKLKIVSIKNSAGECVEPSEATIADGTYNPLSRPVFVYVKKTAYAEKPEVKAFVDYQADPGNALLISDTGYVPMPTDIVEKVQARLTAMTTGTIFEGEASVGVKLSDKL